MTTPAAAAKEPNALAKRAITAVQSKGSLGKSALLALLAEWYAFAGVPFNAVDSDPVHHTLFNRYPTAASLFDATARDEFWQLLGHLPEEPVVLWDFPAQFTPAFIAYADDFRLVEALADAKARLTMLLFASDDPDAQDSAALLVEHFGQKVDWVLVTNPANFKSVEFKKTGLYELLMNRKTPTIDIPHISTGSKNAWADLENEAQRPLPIGEATKNASLPFVARLELSGVLDRMFVQFEDIAPLMVPDPALIKNRTTRVKPSGPKTPVNRFQNPLLAKK